MFVTYPFFAVVPVTNHTAFHYGFGDKTAWTDIEGTSSYVQLDGFYGSVCILATFHHGPLQTRKSGTT